MYSVKSALICQVMHGIDNVESIRAGGVNICLYCRIERRILFKDEG